jgi:hypothetical protein
MMVSSVRREIDYRQAWIFVGSQRKQDATESSDRQHRQSGPPAFQGSYIAGTRYAKKGIEDCLTNQKCCPKNSRHIFEFIGYYVDALSAL